LEIVRLLADGGLHSGETIARRLGISRAALWKALRKADEALGLGIESVRGQGYRLPRPLELLDAGAISAALDAQAREHLTGLEVLADVDSTSSHVLRRAGEGAASGLVCLAERQRAGRGRRGRTWVSPFGCNLYLSILWRYPLAPADLGGLSLAAGTAVGEALMAAGAEGIVLKWPNDVHWRRRKIAGLLLEVSGEAQGPSQVVVGVGVNLDLDAAQAAAIDQPWADMREALGGRHAGRNRTAAALVQRLTLALAGYDPARMAGILDDWRRLDGYRGEPVELIAGERRIAGVYVGIDPQGALLLKSDGATRAFMAGEVSLRPRA
jgi:BirA family biotin operon repressor/biotin-[acetyl-CoA-carboxylase] ligase